jgi:hypothetical protein
LQRRAASCPAAPPMPPTIRTMADFIALVRRVEASSPTGNDPIGTARLISRTKYEGEAWDWMLPSTKGQSGVEALPHIQEGEEAGKRWEWRSKVTPDDLGSLCFKLIVSVPGGGMEDPMHIIAAIVAEAETQPAGTGATGLAGAFVRSLPASVVAAWRHYVGRRRW